MNIFYIALLLCLIYHVYASETIFGGLYQRVTLFFLPMGMQDPIANSVEGRAFREAVQRGRLSAANGLIYSGNDELKNYYSKYLASLESSKLVELINGAKNGNKIWMLRIFLGMLKDHYSEMFGAHSTFQRNF